MQFGKYVEWLYSERSNKSFYCASTLNNIMENFEKTITVGFSCVNTRLAFDTEISSDHNTDLK